MTAPTTAYAALLESAESPREEALIILAEAAAIARLELKPINEVLEAIGMLGEEEPQWLAEVA